MYVITLIDEEDILLCNAEELIEYCKSGKLISADQVHIDAKTGLVCRYPRNNQK